MRVVLHIGLDPGTAAASSERLRAWLGGGDRHWYPVVDGSAHHSRLLEPLVAARSGSAPPTTAVDHRGLASVVEQARGNGVDTLVLSAESLVAASDRDIERIRAVLGGDIDALAVSTAHPTIRWAQAWAHAVLSGRSEVPGAMQDELVDAAALRPGRLQELTDHIGAGRTLIRLVGGDADDGLVRDLSDWLALPADGRHEGPLRAPGGIDTSIELLRRLNAHGFADGSSPEAWALVEHVLPAWAAAGPGEPREGWAPPRHLSLTAIDEAGLLESGRVVVHDPGGLTTTWLSAPTPSWYSALQQGWGGGGGDDADERRFLARCVVGALRGLEERLVGPAPDPGRSHPVSISIPPVGRCDVDRFSDSAEARAAVLLEGLDLRSHIGLEIGPLDSPLVDRRSPVRFADHLDTRGLREKYAEDPNVSVADIVDVDFVFDDRPLREVVGDNRFDYVIASHVIEHVPDVVGWLNDIAAIVVPGGSLRLVVPDRRFTFDHDRGVSTVSEMIAAHVEAPTRPQPGQVADFVLRTRPVSAAEAWEGAPGRGDVTAHRVSSSVAIARDVVENSSYHDVHCWVFTPQSFAETMATLAGAGLIPWGCTSFVHTQRGLLEFYVVARIMEPADAELSWRRMAAEAWSTGVGLLRQGLPT